MIGVAQRHRMTGIAIGAVCKVMNYSHYFQLIFKTFIDLKCVFSLHISPKTTTFAK